MAEALIETPKATLSAEGESLILRGHPGFDNAARLAEAGRAWLAKAGHGKVRFDLDGVEISNSAVLCVLLEWLRAARQAGLGLEAIELPARMRDLVDVSGLTAVFAASAQRLSA